MQKHTYVDNTNKQPLVSVAMATYNGGRFLREQLESIYAQTWANYEVIVCDDCSSDNTVEILEEFYQRYGLKYQINQKNLGFKLNFEKVLGLCRGDYIALADQDDIWLSEKLASLVNGIGDASLVYSDASLIDEKGHEFSESLIASSDATPVTGMNFSYFICNSCVTGCTVMLRRSMLDVALPIPKWESFHDWWFALVATGLDGVAYVDKPLVRYRQHLSNCAGANFKDNILSRVKSQLSDRARKKNTKYYELIKTRAEYFLKNKDIYSTSNKEAFFLKDLCAFSENILEKKSFFKSLFIIFKHKQIIYPNASVCVRLAYLFNALRA